MFLCFLCFLFFVGNLISMGFVDLFRGGVDSRIIAFFVGWEMVGRVGGGEAYRGLRKKLAIISPLPLGHFYVIQSSPAPAQGYWAGAFSHVIISDSCKLSAIAQWPDLVWC